MVMLQNPPNDTKSGGARALLEEPRVSAVIFEHYIHGLQCPASKQQVIAQAKLNRAPGNIMAFYAFRLPERSYRNPSDVSFTIFTSSYFFWAGLATAGLIKNLIGPVSGKHCGGGNQGAGAVATSPGLISCETPPVGSWV